MLCLKQQQHNNDYLFCCSPVGNVGGGEGHEGHPFNISKNLHFILKRAHKKK